MSEIEYFPQELARLTPDGVAVAMTGRAFDEAQTAGAIALTPLVANMQNIAEHVNFIEEEEPLPPLVVFVRSSSAKLIGRWDDRWPVYDNQPTNGMYFSAASLGEKPAKYGSMHNIMEYAEAIGARGVAEMSVPTWKPGTSYVGAFATSLATGFRPIRPAKAPSVMRRVTRILPETRASQHLLDDEAAFARRNARVGGFGEPFAITHSQLPPQLEA